MEPNKMEKHFKRELQHREITPSPMSWDRLDAMLTIAEEKKPKSNYNWLFIAASFLGFVLVGTILFYQSESLVDAKKNSVAIETKPSNEPISKDSVKLPSTTPKSKSIVANNDQPKKREKVPALPINKTALTEIVIQNNSNNQNSIANNSIINQKTEQNNPNKNTRASVDEQLAIGSSSQKERQTTPIKVSASFLLSQVDQELNLSFREKVIHTIDKNFKTVKVALANRNQQSSIQN